MIDNAFADALGAAGSEELARYLPRDIDEAASEVVHGVGGFEALERYELAHWPDREAGLVRFVFDSLANPANEKGEALLMAIIERRMALASEVPPW